MNSEIKETMSLAHQLHALMEAARGEDWDQIDQKLVPELARIDNNRVAKSVLCYPVAECKNPNVRDTIATVLAALNISDPQVMELAVRGMIKMATEDEEKFPSGRAAVFLNNHRQDDGFDEQIGKTLITFKDKAKKEGWVDDLCREIPQLEEILV